MLHRMWNLVDKESKKIVTFIVHEPTLGCYRYLKSQWKYFSFYFFPGSCDSYVKVRLLPEEKFTDVKLPKTHVQKENLYPLYDEIFNM